jgi:NAD(P)-dependent dehydrogenase (short-subunit alcohol dehydrogenase family)
VSVKGRAAIVTGAAQGIGLACAELLARDGAEVLMSDYNGEKLKAAASRLSKQGLKVEAARADVTSAKDVAAMVGAGLGAFGHVDILVNNAGGSGSVTATDIEDVTEAVWDDVVARNLKGPYLCCRAIVPHMKARKYGRIINFSSGLAKGVGRPTGTAGAVLPYAASKGGVLSLTYMLAKALGPFNITVNAVLPGFVLTEPGARVRDWYDSLPEAAKTALTSRNPSGRAGTAAEVASAVLYLASDEASFVSGVALDVAGAA